MRIILIPLLTLIFSAFSSFAYSLSLTNGNLFYPYIGNHTDFSSICYELADTDCIYEETSSSYAVRVADMVEPFGQENFTFLANEQDIPDNYVNGCDYDYIYYYCQYYVEESNQTNESSTIQNEEPEQQNNSYDFDYIELLKYSLAAFFIGFLLSMSLKIFVNGIKAAT